MLAGEVRVGIVQSPQGHVWRQQRSVKSETECAGAVHSGDLSTPGRGSRALAVVLGDFNDRPDSDELSSLLTSIGLRDVFLLPTFDTSRN